jgi:hypothetical protein
MFVNRHRIAKSTLASNTLANSLAQPLGRGGRSDSLSYDQQVKNLFGANLIGYWPLWEASGTVAEDVSGNGRNGAYAGAPTLGGYTTPFQKPAPVLAGGQAVNAYSISLRDVFPYQEGSIFGWGKVSAQADWTDGALKYLFYLRADTSNFISLVKSTTNILQFGYTAGAVGKAVNVTNPQITDWFSFVLTYSLANSRLRAYFNGALEAEVTGIGTWAGVLSASYSKFGSSSGAG